MTRAQVFSSHRCRLGEGAFWHPDREEFFWFDILDRRLITCQGGHDVSWQFDDYVSAFGHIDADTLLLASATGLWRFELATGQRSLLVQLEPDQPETRSNDGRADPQGGFWISTMAIDATQGAGAIYRFYKGTLRKLFNGLTIPNAICFTPDGKNACFTDTVTQKVMRVALDADGWPTGQPELYIDMTSEDLNPDGAVIDADGRFWNAQWGAGRVACYGLDGSFLQAIDVPTPQSTCPAFGGAGLSQLLITTAAEGRESDANAGQSYLVQTQIKGQKEHKVLLS